ILAGLGEEDFVVVSCHQFDARLFTLPAADEEAAEGVRYFEGNGGECAGWRVLQKLVTSDPVLARVFRLLPFAKRAGLADLPLHRLLVPSLPFCLPFLERPILEIE